MYSSPPFNPTLSNEPYPSTSPIVPPQPTSLDSPNLTALGGHLLDGNSDFQTSEWASKIPFGASPPAGLGGPLLGESPPFAGRENEVPRLPNGKDVITQDTTRHSNNGGQANGVVTQGGHSYPDDFHGGFSNASPSISPRAAYRLPISRKNGYQSFGEYRGESTAGKDSSAMYNQRYPYGPPIPHHLQNHPPRQPAVDPHLSQNYGDDRPLGTVTYSGFDTLASSGDVASQGIDNVLIRGYQQKLAILKVDKERCTRIGGLSTLRGEVLGAKILPCLSTSGTGKSSRPLIAVVLHGPAERNQAAQHSRPASTISQDSFEASQSTLLAMQEEAKGPETRSTTEPRSTHYQTTVEVYSLKDQKHFQTLYRATPRKIELPSKDHLIPSGVLSIQAKGRFITVSSGESGEVYIFEQAECPEMSKCEFTCIGKTWTSMPVRKPRSWSSSNNSESDTRSESSQTRKAETETAMVSLSGRWLAIVPPLPPSRSTIHGKAERATFKYSPPGISSHTAPSQPNVTCEIDGPAGDSAFNKIARDVTQEVIRGAKWVGDQGMQAFKSYWYKSSETSPQDVSPEQENVHGLFPPTHANDGNSRPHKGPVVVSILDLQQLSDHQKTALTPQPVATFALPNGCSFLSFVPNGLALLSASVNGDVWHIWDLMRMLHGKNGVMHGDSPSQEAERHAPSVRQIARFTRTTVAKIIDVAWMEPKGEQFALVTARGTVHIFSLPPTAYLWPPARRIYQGPGDADRDPGKGAAGKTPDRPSTASSTFGSAMTAVSGSARPILAAVRGRPVSISNAIAGIGSLNFAAGAGAKGGKVLAAGVNKGIGVAASTVNAVQRRGENRLTLPGSLSSTVLPDCVRWMGGKSRGQLAVTGGNMLQIYTVNEGEPGQRRPSIAGQKPAEFKLSSSVGKGVRAGDTPEYLLPGYWPSLPNLPPTPKQADAAHPLSFAEIETNAPYQPFHTDRRVNLHVYADPASSTPPPGLKRQRPKSSSRTNITHDHSSPWVFGEAIPTHQISRGSAETLSGAEQNAETPAGTSQPVESHVDMSGGGFGEGGHIVITSRRKKGKGGTGDTGVEEPDTEFFEEDCEVLDYAEERV